MSKGLTIGARLEQTSNGRRFYCKEMAVSGGSERRPEESGRRERELDFFPWQLLHFIPRVRGPERGLLAS